jgi:hypothetical protein
VRAPTPASDLTDSHGRPYFLWDVDLTLEEFRERLVAGEPAERDYFLAKLLRQAKPDDALELVGLEEIAAAWPRIHERLGRQREFWSWLLARRGLDAGADD